MDEELKKPRNRGLSADRCDICGHTEYLCPACPSRPLDRPYKFNHGWAGLYRADPELAAVQVRNAKAARALASLKESDLTYDQWDREYQAAGLALIELRASRLKL